MTTKKFTANIEEELSQPEKTFMSDAQEVQEVEGVEGMDELKSKLLSAGFVITKEPKTKKTQVAFQPSLFEKVKAVAEAEGQSINEMLHILLREALAARENQE